MALFKDVNIIPISLIPAPKGLKQKGYGEDGQLLYDENVVALACCRVTYKSGGDGDEELIGFDNTGHLLFRVLEDWKEFYYDTTE